MKLFDLKANQKAHLQRAQEASANGDTRGYAEAMTYVNSIQREIQAIEGNNSILQMRGPGGAILADGGAPQPELSGRRTLGAGYAKALHGFLMSGGKIADPMLTEHFDPVGGGFPLPTAGFSAALYEGSGAAGGYAVPITVDDQIVPLAPQEWVCANLHRSFLPGTILNCQQTRVSARQPPKLKRLLSRSLNLPLYKSR